MAEEITDGGEVTLGFMQRMQAGASPDELFTPDFVDHDPADGQPAGGEGLAWYWARFGESFTDIGREIVDMIATPEHLVTVMELSGTHTGEYRGIAPTGRRFTVRNVQVARFRDGRMSERWGSTDELGIVTQLQAG